MGRYAENIRRTISTDQILGLVQNTFVGNASSFIFSASDVETRFGISSGSVSDFLVVGSDVWFKVNLTQYVLANSAFNALTEPATAGVNFFIDRDGLLRNMGAGTFRYQNDMAQFYAPMVDNVGSSSFQKPSKDNKGADYLYFPDVLSVGVTGLSRQYFRRLNIWNAVSLSTNCLGSVHTFAYMVYAHESLATSNGGGVHAELVKLNNLGKVTFVPESQKGANVDPVTDLSASNITSSTFDLTFTAPPSDNAISFYELWMDDGTQNPQQLYWFLAEISASGATISGIPSGTRKVKIVACDIYWNRSEFSNETLVTIL